MSSSLRALDLFCGAGGSSWGALNAGLDIVCGIDKSEVATEMYALNFPAAQVVTGDIRAIDPLEFYDEDLELDFLLASPECTNHSPAKGGADRCEESRATAFEVNRFAEALRPKWIVVENVIQFKKWDRFSEWRANLRELGYVIKCLDLQSDSFGVPQTRRRLFVVAGLESEPVEPTDLVEECHGAGAVLLDEELHGWGTSPLRAKGRAPSTLERADAAIEELGEDESFILVYYSSDSSGWQRLERPLRTVTTVDRFAVVRPSKTGHRMRMLQPPELAIAMGFPRDLKWPCGNRRSKVRLMGNAVCPSVMEAVIRAQLSGNGLEAD